MTWKPSVLVVAPSPSIATTVFAWLTDAGCAPIVVSSFATAKQYLDEQPAVLISEVRLGEYNGLHLALRAQARGIPSVLIGHPDPVLEREAEQLGAAYLAETLNAQQLLAVIEPIVQTAVAEGRSWRSTVAGDVTFVSYRERPRPQRPINPFRS